MTNLKPAFRLNAFQIKLIALITMTLDHIGTYQTLTRNSTVNNWLGIIGRIAAPLFLFMVVEGMRHTRSKFRYVLRLYAAGTVIDAINRILSHVDGTFKFGNTLRTFFYTALFILCIEHIIKKRRNIKAVLPALCGLTVPFLSYVLNIVLPANGHSTAWSVISIFFPSPMTVTYSILFVIMGILWYFINNKVINCAILALLSLVCLIVPPSFFFSNFPQWLTPAAFNVFELFIDTQWCMCLAIPFMLLYSGEKGRSLKYLFYIYYPVHVYILFFIQYMAQM